MIICVTYQKLDFSFIKFIKISFSSQLCGTLDIHKKLEDQIAKFHGREEAILYPSCYDANGGFFSALLTKVSRILH